MNGFRPRRSSQLTRVAHFSLKQIDAAGRPDLDGNSKSSTADEPRWSGFDHGVNTMTVYSRATSRALAGSPAGGGNHVVTKRSYCSTTPQKHLSRGSANYFYDKRLYYLKGQSTIIQMPARFDGNERASSICAIVPSICCRTVDPTTAKICHRRPPALNNAFFNTRLAA